MARDQAHLLNRTRRTLGIAQVGLARLVGASRRTGQRWDAGQAHPEPRHYHALARAVHGRDVGLAEDLAAAGGTTLEQLGLVAAPAPPPLKPLAAKTVLESVVVKTPPAPEQLVDSVVCAAADALDLSPRAVRPALLAALSQAHRLGLDLATLETALTGQAPAARKKTR